MTKNMKFILDTQKAKTGKMGLDFNSIIKFQLKPLY